jgi:tetratricopeptide (TPR) repeat protein
VRLALRALVLAAVAALGAREARACEPILPEVRAALDAGHPEQAERIAQAAVEKSPDSAPPRVSLAQVYIEWTQRPDALAKAHAELETVVARWPALVRPHVCLLDLHQVRGETEAFFAALERALRSVPASDTELDASLEFTLRRFLEQEQWELASRECEALERRPGITVPALSNCGLARLNAQDLEGARERFRKARAKDPQDALVAQNLGMLESLTGDLDAAERSFEALAALAPERGDVLLKLAVVVTARDPAGSAPAWRRVVAHTEAHPDSPDADAVASFARQTLDVLARPGGLDTAALLAMARALMQTDAALAVSLLLEADELAPQDPGAAYLLGQAYEAIGLRALAYATVERASTLTPPAQPAIEIPPGAIDFEAGRLATGMGRYASALAHLQRARRANPDFANLEYLFGLAHEGTGALAEARREYAACLERENNADYDDWCRRNLSRLADAPAAPAPHTESFEEALEQARAHEASAQGKRFEGATLPQLAPQIASALAACLAPAYAGALTLLVRVGADGSVAETLQPESGPAPACFAARLRGVRLDPPPQPDWWLVYEIDVRP